MTLGSFTLPDLAAALPDGAGVAFDQISFDALVEICSQTHMGYDWNPNRVAMRDSRGDTRLTRYGDYLVLDIPVPDTAEQLSLIWGRGTAQDLARAWESGRPFFRADPKTVGHLEGQPVAKAACVPQPAFGDYIYDLTQQAELPGKMFARRRTYLRSLERTSDSVGSADLVLTDRRHIADIWRVYDRWAEGRGIVPEIEDERSALSRCLSSPLHLSMRGVALLVDGDVVGFAIYDVFGQSSTAHFVKAGPGSATVAATWQALFQAALSAGAERLDGGYDGGLPGLRAAKRGLRPVEQSAAFLVLPC